MGTIVVSTNPETYRKPTFGSSPTVALTVRANGEEAIKVIDLAGNMMDAYIPPATIAPVLSVDAGHSGLPANLYAAYVYVYAATVRYPFVENDVAIGGSLAPRSNGSPASVIQVNGGGNGMNVACTQTGRNDISEIWIFRTEFFAAAADATLQAQAGNLFFLGSIPNDPANPGVLRNFQDFQQVSTGDQIEIDNFAVPTFQFVVYKDPYWWGWGNYPFIAPASWDNTGLVTLTGVPHYWYTGRSGQYIRLSGVGSGGADGLGGFIFKFVSSTTGQLTTDGTTPVGVAAGAGNVVIQGFATTLYRSKRRNPFSWGQTEFVGQARVPSIYAAKVGGGQGTAIGVVPNINYLLLSTEYPSASYVLDLKLAGTPTFEGSLKQISNFYSISAHFSQFAATKNFTLIRELPEERTVLWGWDAKNYAILECDGTKITPISQRISNTLRNMSQDRARQILAHGAYDARNKLNCMWLPSANSMMPVNLLVAQHGPTGEWFMHDEHDIFCSAAFQDSVTNLSKIYVGTTSGLVGEAFAEGWYSDWQRYPYNSGVISSADGVSITRNDGGVFNSNADGYVGAWCLVTDQNGENEQWARIQFISPTSIIFDFIQSKLGGSTLAFNPIPQAGWLFYVGLIECRMTKYFDFGQPATEKKLSEIWLTLDGIDSTMPSIANKTPSTFIRYYRDFSKIPFTPRNDGLQIVPINTTKFEDGAATQEWFTSAPPNNRHRIFGLEIIDRGYKQWRIFSLTLKAQ